MNKAGKFSGSRLSVEIKEHATGVGNEAQSEVSPDDSKQGGAATRAVAPPVQCLCSPTKHAGSFRCRHHRNSFPGKENI